MTFRLDVTFAAEHDVLEAAHYLEKMAPSLGDRFLDDVDAHIAKVLANPKHYAVKYRDQKSRAVRWCNLKRFPYQVFFRIKEDVVVVIGIRYAGKSPETRPGLGNEQLDC